MFFTQEDYKKILTWLNQNAIKDSEFKEASLPLNEYDIISFVLNGNNVKVRLKDFLELLFLLREFSDFINVTDKYKAKYILLKQAILLVPYKARKIGQVITFLNEEKEWKIYQFKGESVNQWNEESLWEDIVKAIQGSDLVADEEDLTEVVDEVSGKSLLKLKDKAYDPDNFSGLGRVILRKNIVTVLNPDTLEGQDINLLTLLMINKPNTIYEIQYDFDLNNLEITIPEGCVLDFKGGSLSNGSINFNKCKLVYNNIYILFFNINIIDNNKGDSLVINEYLYADIFYIDDIGDSINKVFKLCNKCKLLRKQYNQKTTIRFSNNKCLIGVGSNKILEIGGYQQKGTEIILKSDINSIEITNAYNIFINNIAFENTNNYLKIGILINNSIHCNIKNVLLNNFDIGIKHFGGFKCRFENIIINNSTYGIYYTSSISSQVNGDVCLNVYCKFCFIGFKIDYSNNCTFIHCYGEVIHEDYKKEDKKQICGFINTISSTNIVFINPYLEGCDLFIHNGHINNKYSNVGIFGGYYNSHAGETYIKPFKNGIIGYLRNTIITNFCIINCYYSGSGQLNPLNSRGVIILHENNILLSIIGGVVDLQTDNNTIKGCKFFVKRFNGVFDNTKNFCKNIDIQDKFNVITKDFIDNSLTQLNETNKGFTTYYQNINKVICWNGDFWVDSNGNPISALKQGTTQQRPNDVKAGFYYFDTTLNKPIWKKDDISEDWVDATGAKV